MRSNSHNHISQENQDQQTQPKKQKKKLSLRAIEEPEDKEKIKINEKINTLKDQQMVHLFQVTQDQIKMEYDLLIKVLLLYFRLESVHSNIRNELTFLGSKYIKNLRLEDLEFIQRLGQGKFGQVDKVIHSPTQEYYALKKIYFVSDDTQENFLKKELIALIDCDSPYIVRCYGAFYQKGEIYILLEYMELGSLEDIINKVGHIVESILMIITHQILNGLQYLHYEKKIIHRDIKPHNILINKQGEVKIADFGICSTQQKSSEKWQTFIGTLGYMSPERINGEEYGMDSDIWSLGIMVIQCFMGKLPLNFNPKTMALIEYITILKKFDVSEFVSDWTCSKHLKEFVIQCLKIHPIERAKASNLLESKAIKLSSSLNMDLFKNWIEMAFEDI